ncbi:hypothetical protein DRQ50_10100 [bacterium]|nr:MAG: hypothetical protein DRQ50_10100 [bacterium]
MKPLTLPFLLIAATATAQLDLSDHTALPVVQVPAEAVLEQTIELQEVWRLDCGAEAEILVGRISTAAAAPGGGVLVLDRQLGHVLLVDNSGSVRRTYGRSGEGPGETKGLFDVCALSGNRIALMEGKPPMTFGMGSNKVVVLNEAGDPLGTLRFAPVHAPHEPSELRGIRTDGKHLLIGYHQTHFEPPNITSSSYLVLSDDQGKVLADLGSRTHQEALAATTMNEADYFEPYGTGRFDLAVDGRMALLPERDAYVVVVRDMDGGGVRLEGTTVARQRSRSEIDVLVETNSGGPFAWEACVTEPALVGVHFRPDGKLWVERCPLTAPQEAGSFGAFDEFDREGRLLRRVHLRAPGDAATDRLVALSDGRYVLVRNHHVAEDSEAEDVELEVVLLREGSDR